MRFREDPTLALLRVDLDEGEAEAILLATQAGAGIILLDEHPARSAAQRVGLTPLGTAGVLVWAKRAGLIPSLRDALQDLQNRAQFRLENAILRRAIEEAGQ